MNAKETGHNKKTCSVVHISKDGGIKLQNRLYFYSRQPPSTSFNPYTPGGNMAGNKK